MKLEDALKISLQELRMQMLGAQVLFGFQLQGLFQDNFEALPTSALILDGIGLACMVAVIGLVLAVPSQHRLVERGETSLRIYRMSMRYAVVALVPLAAAIGCDVYASTRQPYGLLVSATAASCALFIALVAWFGLGMIIYPSEAGAEGKMAQTKISLHTKIEQMLTEARVVLPGAQALLGFQLIVMMTSAFGSLPSPVRWAHLAALLALAVTIALLIAPAAIHRLSFHGHDDPRMHSISSVLITIAMLPLAAAISCDVWVALTRLVGASFVALIGALLVFAALLTLWFGIPFRLRRLRGSRTSP